MPTSDITKGREDIHELLLRIWGYDRFRPQQEAIIRSVLDGRDTLALLPTGGGKSLCFQVPALAIGRLCLVVSPLVALMKDQVGRLRQLGVPARAIISTMSSAEIDNALESAALGKLAFLYVSPERLASDLFKARWARMPVGLIAVDEAHCISQWGYDFRPAYLNIAELRAAHPTVPVIALSASATPDVADDIMARLGFRAPNLLRGAFERPELTLWVSHGDDAHGRLLRILRHIAGTAIVYVRERRAATRLADWLNHQGINAAAYHAGLTAEVRDARQKEWTSGPLRCMVATNAFGMGIDKSDVRVVVHMAPPPDLESYYQEAGRAGRDGQAASAFLLVGPGDIEQARERCERSFPPLADVRRVYQAFADMHAIALGSGNLETYDLDIAKLAKRTELSSLTVAHAMRALELDGRLSLSDGVRVPSRVLITADQRVVYSMRVSDERLGPLLEALLRNYGGLFEEPTVIDELKLARGLGWQQDTVIKRLHDLDQQQVLSYRARRDAPAVTLLQPRSDAHRLVLDAGALETRRQRSTERLLAMIRYIEQRTECRSQLVARYFGASIAKDCDQCDVCRSRSHYPVPWNAVIQASEPAGPDPERIGETRWHADGARKYGDRS